MDRFTEWIGRRSGKVAEQVKSFAPDLISGKDVLVIGCENPIPILDLFVLYGVKSVEAEPEIKDGKQVGFRFKKLTPAPADKEE